MRTSSLCSHSFFNTLNKVILMIANSMLLLTFIMHWLQPPKQKITDPEELRDFQLRRRKDFEDNLRKNRTMMGNWLKYAAWEESQREIDRFVYPAIVYLVVNCNLKSTRCCIFDCNRYSAILYPVSWPKI